MDRYYVTFGCLVAVLSLLSVSECNQGWEFWLGKRSPEKRTIGGITSVSEKSKRDFPDSSHSTGKPDSSHATGKRKRDFPDAKKDRPCPCSDASLCRLVNLTVDREVYGFALSLDPKVYSKYDWDKLTTIAMWNFTDDLMCLAHKHNVKLHLVAEYPYEQLTNLTYRKLWISTQVGRVKREFLDGINFDPEYPIAQGSPERQALVDLVNQTKIALNRELPGAMVTFDAAWATYCVDERCYDYKGLADVTDFLFIMAYCVQGQIWGPCIAMSNTPFFRMMQGVRGFLTLGIPPSKLVLGLPWFGYDYPCESLSSDDICEIPAATYHGAPCSDLVGDQRGFDEITYIMDNSTFDGTLWSADGQSPQFNYLNQTGAQRQMHYDDVASLLLKYLWAVSNDLRGVGFWHIGYLNDMDQTPVRKLLRKRMWDLIPSTDNWENYAQNALKLDSKAAAADQLHGEMI